MSPDSSSSRRARWFSQVKEQISPVTERLTPVTEKMKAFSKSQSLGMDWEAHQDPNDASSTKSLSPLKNRHDFAIEKLLPAIDSFHITPIAGKLKALSNTWSNSQHWGNILGDTPDHPPTSYLNQGQAPASLAPPTHRVEVNFRSTVASLEPPVSPPRSGPLVDENTLGPSNDARQNSTGTIVEQQTLQTVNIKSAGNVFKGNNYGNVFMNTDDDLVDLALLGDLPSHPDITGQISEYFSESRSKDEEVILDWTDKGSGSELVLCVLGRAGVGKSTLAKHVSEKLRAHNKLAAAIFFGFLPAQWGVESIIKLIANQLGSAHHRAARHICEAMRTHGGPSVAIDIQIDKFILEPIRSLQYGRPLVVLLDALDQWASHPKLAKALAGISSHTSLIRFVVVGRPGLQERFQGISITRHSLQDVPEDIMKSYITARFDQIHWKYDRKPDEKTVSQLAAKAQGLFVWAATVCSLLEDEMSSPDPFETLTSILNSRRTTGESDSMTSLYQSAIMRLFPKAEHRDKFKRFMGAVIVLQSPLSCADFAVLAGLHVETTRKIHSELACLRVGGVGDSPDTVYPAASMFHLSFSEYLQGTPADSDIHIHLSLAHSQLGLACLEELQRFLPSYESGYVSPLQKYAVRYWPLHIVRGTPSVTPQSDADWRNTPHCTLLNTIENSQLWDWCTLFLLQEWEQGFPTYIGSQDDDDSDASDEEATDDGDSIGGGKSEGKNAAEDAGSADPEDDSKGHDETEDSEDEDEGEGDEDIQDDTANYDGEKANATEESGSCGDIGEDAGAVMWHATSCLCNVYPSPYIISVAETAVRLRHRDGNAWFMLAMLCHDAAQSIMSEELIEHAVHAGRHAYELTDEEDREGAAIGLASSLCERWRHRGSFGDLEESVRLSREVLVFRQAQAMEDADSLWGPLNNLAYYLQFQFEITGELRLLEEAIALQWKSLSLTPEGHVYRSYSLNNLAKSLYSQFQCTGAVEVLEKATDLNREALLLRPPGDFYRALSLSNLALTLVANFRITGVVELLDEAISMHKEALSLRPPGHPEHPDSLNFLGSALAAQFQLTGLPHLLEETIAMQREALSRCPSGHIRRLSTLRDLAWALLSRYELHGKPQDLEESISLSRECLAHTHAKCPERSGRMVTLAMALRHGASYLDESLSLVRSAVQLAPHNWEFKKNLSLVYLCLYNETQIVEKLGKALTACQKALKLCPAHERPNLEAQEAQLHELQSRLSSSS